MWGSFGSCFSYNGNFHSILGLRVSVDGSFHQKIFFEFQYDDHQKSEPKTQGFIGSPDLPTNRLMRLYNKSFMIGYGKYLLPHLALIGYSGISWGSGLYRGEYNFKGNVPINGFIPPDSRVYELNTFRYMGIPFDLKLLGTGLYSGFSLDLYYNYHKHSDYGIILSGNIGKIRTAQEKEH